MSVVTFKANSHGGADDVTMFTGGFDYNHTTRAVSGANNATVIVTLTVAGGTEFENKFVNIARGDYVVISG